MQGMIQELNRQSLKSSVMRQIQCKCGSILDVRRAVEVTAIEQVDPVTETVRFVQIWCHKCWDSNGAKALEIMAHHYPTYKFETIDGREVW